MLKIAIPIDNDFTRKSVEILRKSGVDFLKSANEFGVFCSQEFPAQIRIMEFEQIISAVESGAQDIGIIGEHHFINTVSDVCCVHTFSSYKTNFSLFVSNTLKYRGLESMTGRKIATPFPNLVNLFFKKQNIRTNVFQYQKHLGLAIELGMADGICVLFDERLRNFYNQLCEVEVIMQSSPIIIKNKKLIATKQVILDELIDRIKSVQNADGKKMVYVTVPLEKKDSVLQVLESYKYKMFEMAIDHGNLFVFNTVADEKHLWDLQMHLKLLGAVSIYVLPIEKII